MPTVRRCSCTPSRSWSWRVCTASSRSSSASRSCASARPPASGLGIWLLFTVVAAISALLAGLALAGRDVLEDEPSWLVVAERRRGRRSRRHRPRPRARPRAPRHGAPPRARGRGDRHRARARGRRDLAALVRALAGADRRGGGAVALRRGRGAARAGRAPARPGRRGAADRGRARRARRRRGVVAERPARARRGQRGDRLGRPRPRADLDLRRRHVDERQPRPRRRRRREERGLRAAALRGRRRRRPRRRDADEASGASRPPSSTSSRAWRARPPSRSAARARTRRCGARSRASASSPRSGGAFAPSSTSTPSFASPSRRRRRRSAWSRAPSSGWARSASRCRSSPSGTPPESGRWGTWRRGSPALNLASRDRRTVAVDDVATTPELEDPTLGDRETLLELGTRSVLATPIVVFDRVIGVFSLHRAEAARWLPGEIALAEAVARELGLAIHTARLLGENEQRLRRQETLIEAAQVLTSDLRFESVIRRLVEEVVALTGADAADCWIIEPVTGLLRCRAVVGVPEWNIGRQIPAEGTIGRALQTGKSVAHARLRGERGAAAEPALRGLQRRSRHPDHLARRGARRPRRLLARARPLRRGRHRGRRGVRPLRLAGAAQRRELRGARAPDPGAARLLPDRAGARHDAVAGGDPGRPRPGGLRGARRRRRPRARASERLHVPGRHARASRADPDGSRRGRGSGRAARRASRGRSASSPRPSWRPTSASTPSCGIRSSPRATARSSARRSRASATRATRSSSSSAADGRSPTRTCSSPST